MSGEGRCDDEGHLVRAAGAHLEGLGFQVCFEVRKVAR